MSDEFFMTTVSLENVPLKDDVPFKDNFGSRATRVIEGPKTRVRILAIEWAAIAVGIVVAVIEHVVEKEIDKMFGENSPDLSALLQDFVHAIAAVVRQQFDEHDLRLMAEDAASTQSWFRMYRNAPNQEYLSKVLTSAHDLTFHAASFTYRAVSTYAIAGGLELAALHEKAKHDHREKKNLVMRANELVQASSGFKSTLEKYNRSRFSELQQQLMPPNWPWVYWLDGNNMYETGYPVEQRDEAEKVRQTHIAKEFARLETQILVPFYEVQDKWRVIGKG
jgi:hypothetical protein